MRWTCPAEGHVRRPSLGVSSQFDTVGTPRVLICALLRPQHLVLPRAREVWTLSSVSETCEPTSGAVDHRKGPRRRGDALYAAIFEATLDELATVGYAELKMEHIASRAKASKGSLYRRWSCRAEL